MKSFEYGLVGLGKLGSSMMEHWNKVNFGIGIYHPNQAKATEFITRYENSYILTTENLEHVTYLILALPANAISSFLDSIKNIKFKGTIINMATNSDTSELTNMYPHLTFISMKFMGHSKDLADNGDGLFITENHPPKDIELLYNQIGEVVTGNPMIVQEVNKLATFEAIKASIKIEELFTQKKFSDKYIQRALQSIAPEVMRSYSKNNLGHFGQQIVNEIKNN